MSADQRQRPRRAVETEFRLGDSLGLGEILLDTHDLSTGGVFLKADLLFEEDEELDLEFTLPGHDAPVRTRGRIAWVSRGGDSHPAGMGIQFLDLSDGDRASLEAYLAGPEA